LDRVAPAHDSGNRPARHRPIAERSVCSKNAGGHCLCRAIRIGA
jgi:hypothetical protein